MRFAAVFTQLTFRNVHAGYRTLTDPIINELGTGMQVIDLPICRTALQTCALARTSLQWYWATCVKIQRNAASLTVLNHQSELAGVNPE